MTNAKIPYVIVFARRKTSRDACQGSVRPQGLEHRPDSLFRVAILIDIEIVKLAAAPRCGRLTMEKTLLTVWETLTTSFPRL